MLLQRQKHMFGSGFPFLRSQVIKGIIEKKKNVQLAVYFWSTECVQNVFVLLLPKIDSANHTTINNGLSLLFNRVRCSIPVQMPYI